MASAALKIKERGTRTVTLMVVANGLERPLRFIWYHDGKKYTATDVPECEVMQAGVWKVEVLDAIGGRTDATGTIAVSESWFG